MSPAVREAPTRLTLPHVWSPQRRNRRDVDVYLPASYDPRHRYPVVYMHDGQNLSDPAAAFAGTWQLDAALRELVAEGLHPIIVGVHNAGDERVAEYSPYRDRKHGGGSADSYLAFLIDTVKPRIDRLFRTRRQPAATVIAGSSMGGLVSLYAWFRRPDVFGRAAVMSPALWFGRERVFAFVARTPMPPRGRLYLDVGLAEGAGTLQDARAMRELLEAKGLQAGSRLSYLEDRGGRHEEAAWARRLPRALAFLLADRPPPPRAKSPRGTR
jgi:predicted alpha/beta superfamily hydrolase